MVVMKRNKPTLPEGTQPALTPAEATGSIPAGRIFGAYSGFIGVNRLAGEILLEPVDVVVAVDDIGLPHQRAE